MIDSRYTEDCVRRRRECHRCGHRWSTFETSVDPRELRTMGTAIRRAFDREATKRERFSVTAEGQKTLDNRAAKHEREVRNGKIRRLYKEMPIVDLASRVGTSINAVKSVARKYNLRKRGPQNDRQT